MVKTFSFIIFSFEIMYPYNVLFLNMIFEGESPPCKALYIDHATNPGNADRSAAGYRAAGSIAGPQGGRKIGDHVRKGAVAGAIRAVEDSRR